MDLLFGKPIGLLGVNGVASSIVIGAGIASMFIRKSAAPKAH